MTKIDLITGFLGAGKTTFLKLYARRLLDAGENIAILENDFGAVNVDAALLDELKCDRCSVETVVGGGDYCCFRRRFRTQLISLGMRRFDRVIVEPSGIFDADEFFDAVRESPLDSWFEPGNVIGIVDAGTPEELPEQLEYVFASETACCGKLVVSKTERFPEETAEAVAERTLSRVNRALEGIRCDRRFAPEDVVCRKFGDISGEEWEKIFSAGYRGSAYVKKFRVEELASGTKYVMNAAFPREKIIPTIERLFKDRAYGDIARVKGFIPDGEGGWLKLNAERGAAELAPSSSGQAVLIFIGEDIDLARIDETLRAINADPGYVSI